MLKTIPKKNTGLFFSISNQISDKHVQKRNPRQRSNPDRCSVAYALSPTFLHVKPQQTRTISPRMIAIHFGVHARVEMSLKQTSPLIDIVGDRACIPSSGQVHQRTQAFAGFTRCTRDTLMARINHRPGLPSLSRLTLVNYWLSAPASLTDSIFLSSL